MFFNSIKKRNKQVIDKRNVKYLLKGYYWEKLTSQNFDFLSSKNISFWWAAAHVDNKF